MINYEKIDNLGKAASTLNEQDAGGISALIEEALNDRNNGEYSTGQISAISSSLDTRYFQSVEPDNCLVIARDDKIIVGAGRLVRHGEWEIKSVYVKPSSQGKGIGSKIMSVLEDKARSAGIAKLRLAAVIFPRTIEFYERKGYVKTGVLEFPGVNWQMLKFIAMEKEL